MKAVWSSRLWIASKTLLDGIKATFQGFDPGLLEQTIEESVLLS